MSVVFSINFNGKVKTVKEWEAQLHQAIGALSTLIELKELADSPECLVAFVPILKTNYIKLIEARMALEVLCKSSNEEGL